jgi:drug/metabolite transporter (DMT)-like permease
MSHKLKAHVAVLLANFFFGAGVVAVKHVTPSLMQPLALNFIRLLVALLLFWILFFIKPSSAGIRLKDVPLFIVCAISGVVINQILFIKGTSLTSPVHASLLSLGTPIAITLISVFFLNEKLSWNKYAGLFMGISGAALLILLRKFDSDKNSSVTGDTMILLNATSYASYLVMVKPLMEKYAPTHVIRWVFLFGAMIILPLGWNDFYAISWNNFIWTHWIALAFVVFGATFFAYLFVVYGIAHLGSSVVGSYIYTQPIFATIAAIILFNEKINDIKIIAALLIFAGVYLVNKKKKLSVAKQIEVVD